MLSSLVAASVSRVAQEQSDALVIGSLLFMSALYFVVIVAMITALWKVLTKARQPG